MKTQSVLIATAAAAAAICSSCTTEDYYRSANRSAELFSSVNLDVVDTIKTSAASRQRTYIFPIQASDENGNMNLLTTFADGGETWILYGLSDGAIEAIELAKDRYDFTRQVEFTPATDGRHTINVRVRDDFGNVSSIEKQVYSFTNMQPKLRVSHHAQRNKTGVLYDVKHYLDFSASYDRDNKWGGNIDSLFFLCKAMDYINATGDVEGGTGIWGSKVSDPSGENYGIHVDTYVMCAELYDDGVEWFTDIWVWVKDNENMPSDTVHISIGHVEESLARQAYEGR
jgi:hypothetical protein